VGAGSAERSDLGIGSRGGWSYRSGPPWDTGQQAEAWPPPGPHGTQQWSWAPPPAAASTTHRGRATTAVIAAALIAGAAAGVGVGHLTWASTSGTPAAVAPSGSGSSGSSGSGSSGSSGPGASGTPGGGFGGLGNGDNGSGASGSGNAGSGNGAFAGNGGSTGGGGNGLGGNGLGGSGFGSSGAGSGSVSTSPGSPSDVSAIAAKVTPGLVDINLTLGYQGDEAAGTGMVLTSTGEVLTNNHVIDGATNISVTDLANSKTYSAKVLGYDSTQDVAVLQLVGAKDLQTVSLGDSSKVSIGQQVVGIGNAGGAGGTPSAAGGAVTALNQSITAEDAGSGTSEQLTGLIGTNAQIQQGDSGGPLVNTAGDVVGMDTAGSTGEASSLRASTAGGALSADNGGSQSTGFAIPINTALSILKQVTSGQGTATVHVGDTAFIGIGVESASGGSSGNGLGGNGYGGNGLGGNGYGDGGFGSQGSSGGSSGSPGATASGALVTQVVTGSPAEQAGLVAGDVVTSLDGQSVRSPQSLAAALVPHHPGDKVSVVWTDQSGQSHTASLNLTSGPPA
jgi:S1-C subfamily serine protease